MQSSNSVLGVAGSVRRLVARGWSLAAPSCPGAEPGFVQNLRASGVPWGNSLREAHDSVPALEPLANGGAMCLLRWQGTSLGVSRASLLGAHSTGAHSTGAFSTRAHSTGAAANSGGAHSAGSGAGRSASCVSEGLSLVGQASSSRHWARGTVQAGSLYFPDHSLRHPCCLFSTQGANGNGQGDAPATLETIGGISKGVAEGPGAEGTVGAVSVEGVVTEVGAVSEVGAEGAGGFEGAGNALGGGGAPSSVESELANAPRRVQRFMIQKLLKVKPTEPPSVAALRKRFQMRIVDINRTAKVTKGGKVISFAALVVCGNGEGLVGFGRGKSAEVGAAVDKAFSRSLRNLHYFERYRGRTVASEQVAKYGKTKVYLWPAAKGSSMSAGTTVGGILRLAGFTEVKTKVIGSRNPINTVKATFKALGLIESSLESGSSLDQAVAH